MELSSISIGGRSHSMRATDLGVDFDRERIRPLLLLVRQVGIGRMYTDVIPLSFDRIRRQKSTPPRNGNHAHRGREQ